MTIMPNLEGQYLVKAQIFHLVILEIDQIFTVQHLVSGVVFIKSHLKKELAFIMQLLKREQILMKPYLETLLISIMQSFQVVFIFFLLILKMESTLIIWKYHQVNLNSMSQYLKKMYHLIILT